MFYCNLYFKKEGTTKVNVFALSVSQVRELGPVSSESRLQLIAR